MLKRLKKAGKRVGVMMNTDRFRHEHIEKEYQLSKLVDFVISSCEHGVVKPDKKAYECALKIANREHALGKVAMLMIESQTCSHVLS